MSRAKGKAGQGGRGQNAAKRAKNHGGKLPPHHRENRRERALRKYLESRFKGTYLESKAKQSVKEVRVRYQVVA